MFILRVRVLRVRAQARRHAGTQARRHAGTQARRRVGVPY